MMVLNSNWGVSGQSAQLLEITGCTFSVAENVPFSWYGGTCGTYTMENIETILVRGPSL